VGRVAKVLEFVRSVAGSSNVSEVKVDRGGGDNRTLQHFSDVGDDSHPLPSDYTATVEQRGTGRDSAVGYIDPKNLQKAAAGEKRTYARDASTGDQVVEAWLKNDGTFVAQNDAGVFELTPAGAYNCSNANGSFALGADGVFTANGVTIAVDGTITTPTGIVTPSILVDGKELAGHTHPAGTPPGNTGVNN